MADQESRTGRTRLAGVLVLAALALLTAGCGANTPTGPPISVTVPPASRAPTSASAHPSAPGATTGPVPQVSVSLPAPPTSEPSREPTSAPPDSRPTSAPTKTRPPAKPVRRVTAFLTPSHNIDCGSTDTGGSPEIACQVFARDFRKPSCSGAQQQQAGRSLVAYLTPRGRPRAVGCASDVAVPASPVAAAYGDRFAFPGGTSCTVVTAHVRCVNAARHGFELSRQAYSTF